MKVPTINETAAVVDPMVRLKWNVIHNVILILFCDQMQVKDAVYKSLQYFLYFHPMLFNQDKVSRTIYFSRVSISLV